MLFKFFIGTLMVCFSFSAIALTGSNTSAVTPLETISPSLQSVSSVSDKSLSANFSETMLAPGSAAPGNYTISGLGAGTLVPTPTSVSGGPTAFTLDWAAGEMRDSVALTLTASGVQDAVGNPINPAANNASCPGMGTVPVFSELMVMPTEAASGDTVTISFSVSEPLQVNPEVTINGHPATPAYGKAEAYIFEYEVQEGDPLGMAAIEISGVDLAGNIGTLSNTALLEIVEAEPGLPMWGWPLAATLLLALGVIFLRHRSYTLYRSYKSYRSYISFIAVLYVIQALACSWAFAQAPTVSNVTMAQSPNTTSTQVDIYYDLDAPNGPCAITVSLSKDGGADGYSHPVTSVTGDLADVATGTGYHIVWDVRADYPEEDLPDARILVTADDGLALFTLTYTAGPGGAIVGGSPQDVVEGHDGALVEAVPNTAYHFVDWSDGVLTATRQDMNVTADVNVTANFAINTYDITCNEVGNGTCVADPVVVDHGDTSDITATPAAGWHIVSIVDSEEGRKLSSYTTTPVTVNRTVTATFEENERTILLPGDVPLELVWIPGGTFMMGRYPGEADSYDSEDPQHPVTLAYGFWMGKYEVTQQQWLAVQSSWPGTAPSAPNGIGDNCPAYYISWNDTKDFITTLNAHIVASAQGPLVVRLPSEAEWEYACRAGTQTRFYFGDSLGCTVDCADCVAGTLPGNRTDYMWYCGNSSPSGSKPVGGKLPNALGLYDMSGNIYEWCEDDWHDDYTGAPADGSAWMDSPRASDRIFRGGDWGTYARWCRSGDRNGSTPAYRDYSVGFRLAVFTPPPEVTSFAINGGAASTMDPVVTLNNTAMNGPTEYMASEASDFSDATWQPYDTAPIFNLSFGVGTRTVYFKVRNAGHEVSTVVSDTIFLVPNTVGVNTGMFTMGRTTSGDDAVYGSTDEDPQHEVMLGTYQIGKGELTNKEYCDVLNWALAQGYLYADATGTPWSGSGNIYAGGTASSRYLAVFLTSLYCDIQYSDGVFTSKIRVGLPGTTDYSMDMHPMGSVSWYGSAAFCNWLSEWQGLTPCYDMNSWYWPLTVAPPTPGGYRLPTEAEWERAAAWDGSKHWIYSFLSDTLTGKDRANYMDNAPDYVNPLGLTTQPFTSPVMWFNGVNVSPNGSVATVNSPSPVGAYDMSGNLIEWCHDWYSPTYYSGGSMTNPLGPVTGSNRLVRGGNLIFSFDRSRSAYRLVVSPTVTASSIGFRLAKSEPSVGTTSFAINNGAATTADPAVTLNNTCWGAPTEYMVSEASDFTGAAWQPYDTAPTFTLSSGEGGTKTVYFKVRNAEYESAPVSDTIELTGQTITLPGDILLELVWVPGGTFMMGRYPGEADSYDTEDPLHPVTLAYGFWMGKYEITQQQWFAVQGAWPGGNAPSATSGMGNTYPVYLPSWYAAQGFVTSLNAHIVSSGQGPLTVRLPSEAEWEYACRAGTQTRFYWGDDSDYTQVENYAWYSGNNSPHGCKPVGGKLPNAFGLYDMSGNLYEWCEDDAHYDYTGAPSDGSAWIDSPRGSSRVYRGGSWVSPARNCRSAHRVNFGAGNASSDVGFRIAGVPTQVVSFAINGGAATTSDPVVTLDNTATNSPAEYMASELRDFSGAEWQPYDTAPSFTLSPGTGGTKTVYFKVRNAGGESAPISDTIEMTGRTVTLPGDVPLELVWITGGTFMMGSYPGEMGVTGTETPQHPVTLDYGFWMGKYEVTQQQWLAVLGFWPETSPSAVFGLGDTYPAYFISWNDAKYFITSLNAHIVSSGQGPLTVRLPSEAEWEYACRAETQTRFYFGDSLDCDGVCADCTAGVLPGNRTDYMWYCGNNGSYGSPTYGSKPVGGKLPNALGLYDMHGNIFEWCEDDWHMNYTGAPADGSAWIDSPRASYKIRRGGYWNGSAIICRSALRNPDSPDLRNAVFGFRLAAVPVEVVSFAINGGAATTTDPVVTLDNTATNSPTEYMASESPDFNGATWQPYDAAPTFTLSSAIGGTKTVYFKVRNSAGESAPVSDTINMTDRVITLPSDVPLELVWVPSGSFQMGRYPGEADSFDWEDPQHPVTLAYGFWMGKYEITQQQWLAVRGSWPGEPPSVQPSGMYGLGDTYPAYYLSWNDAKDFITALNAHIVSSGQGPLTVRLPSEAEWEYACRAGTATRFYFGDSLGCDGDCSDCEAGTLPGNLGDYLWYCGNNSPNGTKPVGGKLPNALGLYDMHGNAREWCEDDTHYDYIGAPADGGPWLESPRTADRILRGGWFDERTTFCRSACRGSYPTDVRDMDTGFRLAALPTQALTLAINGGAATTAELLVTLDNTVTNSPTEYMASEAGDFSDATWEPYDTTPTFSLSPGVGMRTVYFKVRDAGGEVFNVVSDTIFVLPNTVSVNTGTFTMGRTASGDDATYGTADELPQHSVTLGAYQIGKFEVTSKEYCDVLNWAKSQGYLYADTAGTPWTGMGYIYAGGTAASRYVIGAFSTTYHIQYSGGVFISRTRVGLPGTTNYSMDTHPMVDMTWYGAVAFCNWLSEWQGLTPCYDMNTEFWPLTVAPPTPGGYRLPTEAEWERAAAWESTGGGKHWIYGFISDTLTGKDRANYFDYSPDSVNPLGLTTEPYTSPVGWFNGVNVSPNGVVATVDSPSPVGAYDMSGNVAEWCHDWYSSTWYSGGSMANPTGPATGSSRIRRGGAYDLIRGYSRSAKRMTGTPTNMYRRYGFRLAKSEQSVGATSFAINNGDAATALPSVILDNTCWGAPTEYMASESPDFSDATWQPYDTAPSFTLSSGEGGTKTVYFKVRNAGLESAPVSDTIELTGRTVTLPGDVPLELVWVPSGSYQMGRYPGEVDSVSSEDPQHPVTLAYGFWIGKYEVTQQQWLAVRGAWPGTAPSSGWGLGNAYPAYNISWDDVQDFNTSLNAHIVSSGQGPLTVRLPSEAEWEYACRAGTQTRFYWGDDPGYTEIGAYAWYSTGATNPVGGKTANDLGLCDMSGNVFEWCEDDYHDGYTGAPADGSAWIDSPRAAIRIVRGGSWGSDASYCRSAFRSGYTAGGRGTNYGFRLAAVP